MRFFSNEAAKENTEEQAHDDRTTTSPATVPQQRAGSPWNDAPGAASGDADTRDSADAELADAEHRETDTGEREGRFEETDTVRDDAATGPAHAAPDEKPDRAPDDLGGYEDTTDSAPAGGDDQLTYGPDGTVRPADEDGERARGDGRDWAGGETRAEDAALKDEGDFDSPTAVEPSTGEPLEGDESGTAAGTRDGESARDDMTRDDMTRDDMARDEEAARSETVPLGEHDTVASTTAPDTDTATDADAAPAVAGAGVASGAGLGTDAVTAAGPTTAADTPEPVATGAATTGQPAAGTAQPAAVAVAERFFTDGESYVERFREIQLRFVDTPKEAAADAAALLSEAVNQLTSALKTHQDQLASNSDDTEKLRVELRGYRDLLNRLTGL